MDLKNEFEVDVPIDEAWDILTDVELIAPCLPGAQLQEIEGDEYRGAVKVKVGPITAQYKGAATFLEQDKANYKAVLKGDGRETRGQGNANAIITLSLEAKGDASTKATVDTDLTITGKVAQFGRGVIVDVSAKLLDQFVENLETKVLAGRDSGGGDGAGASSDSGGSAKGKGKAAAAGAGAAAAAGAAATTKKAASKKKAAPKKKKKAAAKKSTAKKSTKTTAAKKTAASESDEPKTSSAKSNDAEPAASKGEKAAPKATASSANEPEKPEAAKPEGPKPEAAEPDEAKPKAAEGVRKINMPEPEAVDLLGTAGAPLLKRAAPAAVGALVLLLILRRLFGGGDDD